MRDKFYQVIFRGQHCSIKIGNGDKINMIKYDHDDVQSNGSKGYYLDVLINNLSIYDDFSMDMKNYHYYHVFEVNNCDCKGKNGLKYEIELMHHRDSNN